MPQSFEIGLVMAGAVSAGAYSAGVVDFLYEALDAYYAARAKPGWNGPRHDVRIPIMTGASAGGMTAAIAALHAFRDLQPAESAADPPPPERNRLYSSWVSDISIDRLLATTDLDAGAPVQSALCSDVLDTIVSNAFTIQGALKPRDWIGRANDPTLRLRLTLTNTRGVPYSFPVFGEASNARWGMLNHADFQEFVFGTPEALQAVFPQGATPFDVSTFAGAGRPILQQATLATGAFPIALRARLIQRDDASFYSQNGRVGFEGGPGDPSFVRIDPDADFNPMPYNFVAVDGGVIDNEPLELARRYLAGAGLHNDRNGVSADKAVLLIAPFPNFAATPPEDDDLGLPGVASALIAALRHQARFKPDELEAATNDRVFSRFLISPVPADENNPLAVKYPIACGALYGFSGFLDKTFRRHDYLLGRRNAQAFLRWNFGLPRDNPLFADANIDPGWLVRDAEGTAGDLDAGGEAKLPLKRFATSVTGEPDQPGFPIIPLTPELRAPIRVAGADLPRPAAVDRVAVKAQIEARVRVVLESLVNNDLPKLFPGFGALDFLAKDGARTVGAFLAASWVSAKIDQALDELAQAFP